MIRLTKRITGGVDAPDSEKRFLRFCIPTVLYSPQGENYVKIRIKNCRFLIFSLPMRVTARFFARQKEGSIRLRRVILLRSDIRRMSSDIRFASLGGRIEYHISLLRQQKYHAVEDSISLKSYRKMRTYSPPKVAV